MATECSKWVKGTIASVSWWPNYFGKEISQVWLWLLLSLKHYYLTLGAPLVSQTVKNLPAMQETWVQSLGWEDPLEKEMATYSSSLPGESHGQRSLVGYVRSLESQRVRHDWSTNTRQDYWMLSYVTSCKGGCGVRYAHFFLIQHTYTLFLQ